ncbi:MAG: aldo/keto reductase [Bacteroidales bacterium]|nr:aldo/keto reductase [Bacteroidales bacterium]
MIKVKLGKSDVHVTPVTFGAWAIGGWMWGGADRDDAIDALNFSIDQGMTSIDTAPAYGFGLSEELVGEVIKGRRDKVEILTKYGLRWDTDGGGFYFDTIDNDGRPVKMHRYASKESVIAECEASLKRLGTDYIDLYQIHWPDTTTPVEETMEAVERLIEQGKVRASGVCNYDVSLAEKAAGELLLASNQVPYSMVRRDIEQDLVPWCIENEVAILAYSPLQRGLLTGKIKPDHQFGDGDTRPNMPHFKSENIALVNDFLDKLKPVAMAKNATVGQIVIAWTLAQPGITVALVGARNRQQVEENIKGMGVSLTDIETEQITEELNQLKLNI